MRSGLNKILIVLLLIMSNVYNLLYIVKKKLFLMGGTFKTTIIYNYIPKFCIKINTVCGMISMCIYIHREFLTVSFAVITRFTTEENVS